MQVNETTRRLTLLLAGLLLWSGLLFGRLVWLQTIRHDEFRIAALKQQQKTVELPAPRGSLLARDGQPLAMTLEVDSVAINPQKIEDIAQVANVLSASLHLDRADLQRRLRNGKARDSRFLWVARKLLPEESDRVRKLKIDGLEFRKEMQRYYPHGQLAANVLGSVGFLSDKDVVESGNGGIELTFNKDLAGQNGEAREYRDSRQNSYDRDVVSEPIAGADVMLTIDPKLQYHAEQNLEAAVKESQAEGGSVVVMDPYTGDILAMASYPTFDPNLKPQKGENAQRTRTNLAVEKVFEPGSVYKVITLSAALEKTNLTPDTMINCGNGQMNLYGRVIHDHDRYSALTMAQVLAKSSNIGAINIALATGAENFYSYQKAFGFGEKTGVPLPGETRGILWPVSKWTKSSIGSLAMGHELGVTSLQLARAGAVIANGGTLVKPRLVLQRQRKGQEPQKFASEIGVRVLKPETVGKMRQMMEGVVLEGTGKKAIMAGYTSAGKTGSAQVYDQAANVYTHTYNASFLGFAPVGNPRVVVAVSLHGTKGGSSGFGGVRAAPVFREVALSAMRMLDVPHDLPLLVKNKKSPKVIENDLAAPGPNDASVSVAAARMAQEERPAVAQKTSPGFAVDGDIDRSNNGAREVLRASNDLAWNREVSRARAVSSVTTPLERSGNPNKSVDPIASQRPFLEPQRALSDGAVRPASGAVVPDFRGMTKRGVMEESLAAGFPVELQGDGLVSNQDPPPGSSIRPGVAVKVRFGR